MNRIKKTLEKTYDVKVPVGDTEETEKSQVSIQFVPEQGWRVSQIK
jgi:hypothetical protein